MTRAPTSDKALQTNGIEFAGKGLGLLLWLVLGGCEAAERASGSTVSCSPLDDPGAEAVILKNIGDQPIYHGRLYVVGGRLEFRPCDKSEIYLVVADLPIEDALHQYTSIHYATADAPVYVRFNGYQLDCKAELPDRSAGMVEVNRIQARETAIPASCR